MRGTGTTHIRSDYCGTFRITDIGREISVCGWVQRQRELGPQLVFVDLRDRTGVLQLAFDEKTDNDVFAASLSLRSEYVIHAKGTIRERSSKNPTLPTGDIELEVAELYVLAKSETPPFEIAENSAVNDALRLKYRYLDLRRPDMQQYIALRHKIVKVTRDFFDENGFYEIETPILTKSTPEGARDYLVPSRIHKGKYYALPQSPQQYKQLLMLSGFDRYFQIARCFRDEDLRADRQPEFTQLDIEMSFADVDDIIDVNERYLKRLFDDVLGIDVKLPIERLRWIDAMNRFGTDRPDMRFGLELINISDTVKDCEFKVFSGPIAAGGSVRMIYVPGAGGMPRKQLDALAELAKTYGAKGLAWAKLGDNFPNGGSESITSSYAKFLTNDENAAIFKQAGAGAGGLILIVADEKIDVVYASLGALRIECAKKMDMIDKSVYKFVWLVEWPLFTYSEEEARYVSEHHPFTAPLDEDVPLLDIDISKCRSKQIDIVLNGSELGGGSIRINTPEMQQRIFRTLGFSEEEVYDRFGHLIDAFKFGAPPHGGIAYGFDRIVMHLAGLNTIRDVIAFPKAQNAAELMFGSPDVVDNKQLRDLGIELAE